MFSCPAAPNVATKQIAELAAILANIEDHLGRAKDVAGVAKRDRHSILEIARDIRTGPTRSRHAGSHGKIRKRWICTAGAGVKLYRVSKLH